MNGQIFYRNDEKNRLWNDFLKALLQTLQKNLPTPEPSQRLILKRFRLFFITENLAARFKNFMILC